MGIAPLVAAVRRRPAHWMFGTSAAPASGSVPDAGPGNQIGLTVELFIGGAWADISPFVYYKNRVKIARGKPNETAQIQPQTCTFTINDRDGRFSPRNPTGPYYGLIGRNTPVRVSRMQNGIRRYRFYGEIPAWPTTSDITGTDVYTTITAAGQMRRLFQGNLPLHSTLYRAFAQGFTDAFKPVAYWPCEDGTSATSIASGLPGASPMALSGQALPTFASNSAFPSSLPLPLLSGSIWTAQVPPYTGGTDNVLRFLMSIPATGAYDGGVIARMYTAGTIARLDLQYAAASNGQFNLFGYDASGTQIFTGGNNGPSSGLNNLPVQITMSLYNLSPNTFWEVDYRALTTGGSPGGNLGIVPRGAVTSVVINPDGHFNDTAIGHVVVQSQHPDFGDDFDQLSAWLRETPSDRFLRLCSEQNVPAVLIDGTGIYANDGDPGDGIHRTFATYAMGYQLSDTFTNLIQEPVTTALGLLYEAREQTALVLRTRSTLYNQAAKLTLDHSQHQLSGPLNPVDDDALTRNDITVTRINASSSRQALTSGTLSTQAPPAGVGDYPTTRSISVWSDSVLSDQAGWALHMGTVDQPRFPSIPVNLRHSTFASNLDLMNAVLTIDIGDRLVVVNPPAGMPPDPISLIVQGYSETMGVYEHDMVFNCSPEDPFRIAILEDPVLGRADTDGSTLAPPSGAYGPTDTTLLVGTTGPQPASPLWTTSAGDFPFDVAVGGERMTVTNITGSGSPQTFTVTRSVNGVVKPQAAGTDVRLWQPMYLSL